jgi:hypothetical protein
MVVMIFGSFTLANKEREHWLGLSRGVFIAKSLPRGV